MNVFKNETVYSPRFIDFAFRILWASHLKPSVPGSSQQIAHFIWWFFPITVGMYGFKNETDFSPRFIVFAFRILCLFKTCRASHSTPSVPNISQHHLDWNRLNPWNTVRMSTAFNDSSPARWGCMASRMKQFSRYHLLPLAFASFVFSKRVEWAIRHLQFRVLVSIAFTGTD